MQTPEFFSVVPTLTLRDPLAEFLGATTGGLIEYSYLDAVKLAGHSCPTVAGAYWLTRQALHALYGANELPERGAIRVEFREDQLDGVTGVIANVVSMLTGATVDTGFKGLAGRYDRRNLLAFNADIPLEIRYTRLDMESGNAASHAYIDAAANLRQVPGEPNVPGLMQRCLKNEASAEERRSFATAWQQRVRRILLEHGDDPKVFIIRPGEPN
ncbi:conserved protein of unknown function [Sterolibacterium denitrificans]|uniref:Formylmethanofuran dehydrogenase subunit E domain-containing protein n=1 Tax=Sterolibacterium denitrificans TaxID=157592 RepID=A0A7Z7MVK3_9PROT|nr:hypothetical protein [Sterolibacterium denitrificans]SMB26013.1 conserved protein of unknown function [Sterolibacterium denitrificans]